MPLAAPVEHMVILGPEAAMTLFPEQRADRVVELDVATLRDDVGADVEWLDKGFVSTSQWRCQSQGEFPSVADFNTPFKPKTMVRRRSAENDVDGGGPSIAERRPLQRRSSQQTNAADGRSRGHLSS